MSKKPEIDAHFKSFSQFDDSSFVLFWKLVFNIINFFSRRLNETGLYVITYPPVCCIKI